MTGRRAAIYCRISEDSARLGLGVERQEEDCRTLAEREGYEVVDVYIDNDISASTISRKVRPAYARLLDDARAGRLDAILAYSNSRLTRRPAEWIQLIELANAGKIRIKTVSSGEHDVSTANGRATLMTVAIWDAREAEETAEKVARAQRQRAEAGLYNGPRPFGYDFAVDDHGRVLTGRHKKLVVNEVEAQIIREVVARVLQGEALWSITKNLNQRGITTATGKPWQTQTLRRMVLRWTHAGYRKHQKYVDGKFVGKETLHEAAWPAIIDRDTHERVLALLTDPSRRKSRSTEAKYLLTSIALCGACGAYLVGTTSYEYVIKGSYVRKDGTRSPDKTRVYPRTYKCPHAGCHAVTRRMDAVDELVEATVVKLLEREGVEAFGGDPAIVRSAQERVDAIEAKLALLTDQWTEDKITDEQMARGTATLRPQLDAEKARLRQAQPVDALREFTGTGAGAAWERASVVTKKRVLRALIDMVPLTITIDPVGAGASSKADASRHAGIRIEAVSRGSHK